MVLSLRLSVSLRHLLPFALSPVRIAVSFQNSICVKFCGMRSDYAFNQRVLCL